MKNQLEELLDTYGIQSDEQFEEYKSKAILALTVGKVPSNNKTLRIIGGQSGAGKSRLISLVKKQSKYDSVVVDFDELRSYHPSFDEVIEKYPEIAHRILHPDTEKVKNEVLNYLIEKGYSTIYEGALRDTQGFIQFAKNFSENDYKIQMHVMAVPKLESYGSVLYRYALALMTDNQPRWVEKSYHDASYDGVIKTVTAFEEEGLTNDFSVYVRSKNEPQIIYPKANQYFKDAISAINFGREMGRKKAVQDYPQKFSIVEQVLRDKQPEMLDKLGEWKKLYEDELEYVK